MVINENEKLKLSKDKLKQIIIHSQFDLSQFFNIIEQYTINVKTNSNTNEPHLNKFLNSIQLKNQDTDIITKMNYLFGYTNKNFDFDSTYTLCSVDSNIIANYTFQNYIIEDIDINSLSEISDLISASSVINDVIYSEQTFDLYDFYICNSCVYPSYILKNLDLSKNDFIPYHDISFNLLNSYNEIKDNYFLKFNETNDIIYTRTLQNTDTCRHIVLICLKCMEHLNDFFDNNKKGKNISKKEKAMLYLDLQNNSCKSHLNSLSDIIYNYKLYQIDLPFIKKNINTLEPNSIDLKIFKRFINIFTNLDSKILKTKLKSHTETAIQFHLLNKIKSCDIFKKSKSTNLVDDFIDDLSNVWKFAK